MRPSLHPVTAFVLALMLFGGLSWGLGSLGRDLDTIDQHALLKAAMLVVSLLLMAVDKRSFAEFGFRAAPGTAWRKITGIGLLLGALTTVAILATPAQGHPMLQGFTLPQLVLWVWLWSSFTEEIFTRGLIQSWVRSASDGSRLGTAVPTSALVFGAMHLSLFFIGADVWTCVILVVATTALGFAAAYFREVSGSLLPAVVVHVAFNVGGLIGGIVYMIVRRIVTGAAPG